MLREPKSQVHFRSIGYKSCFWFCCLLQTKCLCRAERWRHVELPERTMYQLPDRLQNPLRYPLLTFTTQNGSAKNISRARGLHCSVHSDDASGLKKPSYALHLHYYKKPDNSQRAEVCYWQGGGVNVEDKQKRRWLWVLKQRKSE